jgi:hypothetical protein
MNVNKPKVRSVTVKSNQSNYKDQINQSGLYFIYRCRYRSLPQIVSKTERKAASIKIECIRFGATGKLLKMSVRKIT